NARKQFPVDSSQLAGALVGAGQSLLDAKAYADAEPLLREALALREKTIPNIWGTFNTRSQLGGALLGQKKYADAEPLLRQGYAGIKEREAKIAKVATGTRTQALERLVRLYEAWDKPEEAARWRKELEAVQKQERSRGR